MAWHDVPAFDYLTGRGRGIELASDRICEMVEAEDCDRFILADIKEFFGSLEQERVRDVMPLPGQVVSNYLLITPSVPVEVYADLPLPPHICTNLEKAVRQGIPSGSRASSVIASMLLGPSLQASIQASWGRIVVYGDDIAIGARLAILATTI